LSGWGGEGGNSIDGSLASGANVILGGEKGKGGGVNHPVVPGRKERKREGGGKKGPFGTASSLREGRGEKKRGKTLKKKKGEGRGKERDLSTARIQRGKKERGKEGKKG